MEANWGWFWPWLVAGFRRVLPWHEAEDAASRVTQQMLEDEGRCVRIRSPAGLARAKSRGELARLARRSGREVTNWHAEDWPEVVDEKDLEPHAEQDARERIRALRSAQQQKLAMAVLLGRTIRTWAEAEGKSAAAAKELVQRTARSLGKMP